MSNAIALFDTPTTLPTYLQNDTTALALAKQIEGDLSGGASINKLSLRNGKFRFNKEGVEIGIVRADHLDIVIIAANPHVSRSWYAKAYIDGESATAPDCHSKDGRTPEADSSMKQAETCALCPQNVKGSATNGTGKACSYKKRAIVVAPDDIAGTAYAIDVAAMGLFGDDKPAAKMFNLRSYIEALKSNGLIVPSVVTRLSFDDESSVPKLFFKPVRTLTAEEWAQVAARVDDPEIRKMLDTVGDGSPSAAPVAQIAAPAPPVDAAAVAAEAAAKKNRKDVAAAKAAAKAAPAAAPVPNAAPAAKGFSGAVAGVVEAPALVVAPAGGKGFVVDLDGFDD